MSISNPSIFRESLTESSLMYGLCPETYIALGLATVVLLCYMVTVVIGVIGLIWQRSKPHIQARNIYLILANMVANLTLVLLVTLRVIVSKKYYPCFFLSLTFMLYPPMLTLPSILRGCRLYSLYRLNLKKKNLFGSKIDETVDLPLVTITGFRKSIVDNSTSSIATTNSNNESVTSGIASKDPNSIVDSIVQLPKLMDETVSPNIISSRDRIAMRIYEFIASYKFFITIYIVSFIVHLSLWAIVGGIEIGVYNSSGSWVFVESGFFEASHGCNITPKILIVLGIQAAFYIICVLAINVLCILSDRDTFNIKLEELILTITLAVILILYTIFGSIPVITTLVDYFVPYVLIFVVYSWLETIIGVILPVYYSIRDSSQRETDNHSDKPFNNLSSILNDKKSLEIISDFARRSYCLEDVLAWKEIQNFKKLKKRKQAALEFCNTFLNSGSILELNIPNGHNTLKILKEQLDLCVSGEEPPVSLFDELEFQCLFNMIDLLQRLKVRNEYIAKKFES